MTKKQYEEYLNGYYSEELSEEEACEQLCYLASPLRDKGDRTTMGHIRKAHHKQTLGSLVRKYDPVGFEVGFNEWEREQQ